MSQSTIFAQSYTEIITQAYSCAYIDNDYQKAADLFSQAFKKHEAKSSELYYAAEINLKLDNIEIFMQYLSQAANVGYANYYFLIKQEKFKQHFSNFDWYLILFKTKKNFIKFEAEYETLKNSLPNYLSITKKIEGKIDLRENFQEIKHQGKRNTCSVFAATALIEYIIWVQDDIKIDLSEAYNYWAAKKFALTNDFLKEAYTNIDGLAGYLAVEAYSYGCMDEKNWKYENENWLKKNDKRCKTIDNKHIMECFTGIPPKNSKKLEYTAQAIFIDRENIGQYILQEEKPVAMNIFWYFDAVDEKGNFRIPTEEDIDKGGHVILLVGYNSETKMFIFRNSWGTKWGDNGYGTIPEEYIINYYELSETFPYGIDISEEEKIEAIKGSMGVTAKIY